MKVWLCVGSLILSLVGIPVAEALVPVVELGVRDENPNWQWPHLKHGWQTDTLRLNQGVVDIVGGVVQKADQEVGTVDELKYCQFFGEGGVTEVTINPNEKIWFGSLNLRWTEGELMKVTYNLTSSAFATIECAQLSPPAMNSETTELTRKQLDWVFAGLNGILEKLFKVVKDMFYPDINGLSGLSSVSL